jgi:hypothetical protein
VDSNDNLKQGAFMKKLILLFVLVGFFAAGNIVVAEAADSEASFTTAKKVDSSWIETAIFNTSEKPWLHINVPDTDFFNNFTFSYWNYPAPGGSYFLSNQFSTYGEYHKEGASDLYLAFNDAMWSVILKHGEWEINAATVLLKSGEAPYFPGSLKSYDGSTKFTVTPEPVSAGFFLLGGAALATTRRFRRKA